MGLGFWMDNAMEHGKHILIDMGYAGNQKTRDNTDSLTKIISRKNIEIVYAGRVLCRIPPSKLEKILKQFPDIKPIPHYAWCTHTWEYEGMDSLEFAIK